jgi:uncharacterized protein (DUF427 family)
MADTLTMTETRTETSEKRVRVQFGGRLIADTIHPLLVWERPYFPSYFLPIADVSADVLVATDDPSTFDVVVGDRVAGGAAFVEGDHVRFEWGAMDGWYEEEEEVFVHARDPHTRIDALRSTRHVVVEVEGHVVADSHAPVILYETGLPTRYYLPANDVRMDLLSPTASITGCPYKGNARYWSLEVGGRVRKDFVWGYDFPTRESWPIAGMLCFYNERVDLIIDGVRHERPKTKFS